jgi:hypothetical protein
MKLRKRLVMGGRVARIYEAGGILLSEQGEPLSKLSDGALREGTPEAGRVSKCILCGEPSVHWGLFMTGEEAVACMEKRPGEYTGTFFGLCERHDPHQDEESVCDAVYAILGAEAKLEEDLELADEAVTVWLKRLTAEGFSKEDSLRIILSRHQEGKLIEGYEFSQEVWRALEQALLDELSKGPH